ncbi:MAG: hypothetical protein ACTSWN_03225 [Promethearchaeota archaeon]
MSISRIEHKTSKKMKDFIDHIRQDLIDNIETLRDKLMQVIKASLASNRRQDAMIADKLRTKLDRFRETFNYTNPVLKIYRKEETRMLKEKQRLKGVVILLELFLIEISYLRSLAEEALWVASNNNIVKESELTNILNKIGTKIEIYEKSIERYEDYLQTSVGQESLKVLKDQFMEFFTEDELDEVVRLVKREKLDKLEMKYLDPDDMVQIVPESELLLGLDAALLQEPEEEPLAEEEKDEFYEDDEFLVCPGPIPRPSVAVEKAEGLASSGSSVEAKPEKETYIEVQPVSLEEAIAESLSKGEEPKEEPAQLLFPTVMPPEVAEDSTTTSVEEEAAVTPETPPQQPVEQAQQPEAVVETNIENFLKKTTGKSGCDDDIRTFIITKSKEIKERASSHIVPMAKLYEDLMAEHPNWRVKPKKFLRLMRELVKNGIISRLEKLDTGFFMVHFLPPEATQDPAAILELAKHHGFLTLEDVMKELEWPEYRAKAALDFLEQKGLAKTDVSFLDGKRYFFLGTEKK